MTDISVRLQHIMLRATGVDAPEAERRLIALPEADSARRMGEPSATEMLEALTKWVEEEDKSVAQGRNRFMAAAAMNALGRLTREAEQLLDVYDKALPDALLAATAGLATPELLLRLKVAALVKLGADQPKYSALEKARELWVER